MTESGQDPIDAVGLSALLNRASRLFGELDRPDLSGTIQAAIKRLHRPDTVVAVVGEFKQGKSSLVNALLGSTLSPVDDDVATSSVAWFRYRPEANVRVHLRRDGQRRHEDVDVSQVVDYLTESGNPGNTRGVELVEFGLPNPVLERGISVLDTPGTDGIDGAVGRSVLGYLPAAHGLIFVTDASSELNAVELEFLTQAVDLCPNVIVALSKVDLYPQWRRIRDLNAGHLAPIGDIVIAPVSSVLRSAALSRSDPVLNDESGLPELMALLRARVIEHAGEQSVARAQSDLQQAAGLVMESLQIQRNSLVDTDNAQRSIEELHTSRQKLEEVRKAGSRWSTMLSDGITDLNQQVDERLRVAFRRLLEQADETLGSQDPADVWDVYARDVRLAVADLGAEISDIVHDRTGALAEEVTDRLGEEVGINLGLDPDRSLNTEETGLELPESKYNPFAAVLTGLRGGSSGIILLGMIGRLAGLALATPVSVGVGVLFGAKQVMDERKRLLEKRRQEARAAARRYLSQAQTDLSAGVREQIRDVQRGLRDGVSERLNGLNETYTATIRDIEGGLRQAEEERRAVLPRLDGHIAELQEMLRLSGTVSG